MRCILLISNNAGNSGGAESLASALDQHKDDNVGDIMDDVGNLLKGLMK